MRLSEIRELLQFRPIEWDTTTRRLNRCLTIEDLRRLARRRLPGVVFDYIDGGAEDEVTLAANRAAFARVAVRASGPAGRERARPERSLPRRPPL